MTDLVPVVDLDDPQAPALIDDACRRVGFLSVVNHGIPEPVISRMLRTTDAFFAQPLEGKLALQPPSPDINRGYAAKNAEALYHSLGEKESPPDLFEAFNIGPENGPNIWPSAASQAPLKPALLEYFEAAGRVAHRLTGLFALALGMEPGYFEGFTDHSTDTLRVNHYERAPGEPEPVGGQQRMGAHTDYGIVTVLYADRVAGLQILGPDDAWHDVMPAPSALLVNLGDLLATWTNDYWRSTLHRVVPPPRTVTGPSLRRSVAFFHDGNADAVVECLPTCITPERPARYEPVIAGDHLLAKLLGPRTMTASTAASTTRGRPTA